MDMEQHTWKRIDSGSIARCLECSCGFKAVGYDWKEVDKQVADHEAAVKAVEKGKEDCGNGLPPREEGDDYINGYAEEYTRILKATCIGSKV